ncbi:MAG: carboxylating nicotinate-nucleotide diphosphorylase [Hyphomicrobiaceae bacterium]|nr:carboxylating nicotinate-nucleotide diphosphorylase [Hyphomicrobiaceae bacterium]
MSETTRELSPLPLAQVRAAVEMALAEDLGLAGDITTDATIPATTTARGVFAARSEGVVSGLAVAAATFAAVDPSVVFEALTADGARVAPGARLATVTGPARAILTGERVALNFMGRMSGIASLTRQYADAVAGTGAHIADTRKTTPGLRMFEKYAVRCGGGVNHRIGLFDAVLIKDNHIVAAGGIEAAVRAVRSRAGHLVKVEVEVDTLAQLDTVLALLPTAPVDAVLLDNMTTEQLREAVSRVAAISTTTGARIVTEASGGVSRSTVRAIAETGVNLISVGALTHSAPVLDLGLDFEG